MANSNFYDGTKLLSLKDINGNSPEIYICTTNRSAGKTTFFGRMLVKRFFEKNQKFCLIYRFNYELDSIADKFYKDISTLFFPNTNMISERRARGIYHDIYLQYDNKTVSCGYAISLNSADQIKKYSHLLSDCSSMLFDEFQSETNHYCPNEINKFISIHDSIARGNGKQNRYLPVYMIGNPVSIINPYYISLGISERLKNETKFLRGDGFVLEQGFNQSASTALQNSAFHRAFKNESYSNYATQAVYLNDDTAFIEKPKGKSRYLCTIRYKNVDYGVREYNEIGIIYCDKKPDTTCQNKIAVTTSDHNINYVMLRQNDFFISNLRYFFEHGCFRFYDMQCKEAILKTISY